MKTMKMRGWIVGLSIVACGEKDDSGATASASASASVSDTNGDSGSAEGNDSSGADSNSDNGDGPNPGETGAETTGDATADDTGPSTVGFIADPDGGGASIECDVWAQDCPEDEKCMPWANDGGGAWNATKCAPLDPNPSQPGDACTVEGSGVSGIDNCDLGAMCWDVDPETNAGTCIPFCMGSEANPVCEDPNTTCSIANEGTLILCLPNCDPLLQDCEDGQACYPIDDTFVCGPDVSGEMGGYGDACAFINVCDPGLWCGGADLVPDCGSAGCCTTFCDISDPEASANCPGAAGGQECVAWYGEGMAPPGLENVGSCAVPA